jgi:hypothetical protein
MAGTVVRIACILATAGLALLLASDAGAVGGVVGAPGEPVTVGQARYALAISPAQTTRWASIHIEKFPGAMAWLLPIRPGARVDEVSDAWFEALELATAPRVVPASCGSTPPVRATRVEGLPDRVPTVRSLESTVIDDAPALRAFAGEWALELPPEIESRFDDLRARGFSLAAFLYAGPAGGGFTRTVRVSDDAFPSVPLFMTLGAKGPVRVTAFLIGAARARLGAEPEVEIDPASVTFAPDGSTSYETMRTQELLAGGGQSWVIEASERDLLLTGARRPGGVEVTPPIAPAYDQRAASYGDTPDDLTLALKGLDAGKVWVTRAAGIVPANRFGDDVAVTIAPGPSKSPFLLTTQPADCAPPVVVPPSMTVAPPPVSTNPRPTEPGPAPHVGRGPVLVGTTVDHSPPPQVVVSGSCDGSPSSQPEDSSSSDDSCSHSDDTSDTSSSDDGCDSSSDQSSDQSGDGCDSSSSDSSQDQSGSGCDGGSSSSSSNSSSSSDCSMSHRPRRRRSRTSLVAWGMCAVLLPLRRSMRRRVVGR